MRLHITSIFVDDQAKALDVYTNLLNFRVKHDVPLGAHRWLTLVARDDPHSIELLLEPAAHAAVAPYRAALKADGIPVLSLQVDDVDAEHARLGPLGITFTMAPTDAGPVRVAVLDDTCGNLVQLVQPL